MALSITSAAWQQINSPALDIRRYLSVNRQEGVHNTTDMAVAQRGAGANYSVDIGSGEALVRGDTVTNQALYYAYNDAVSNLTGFTAAHATLPRIDRVCLRVRDAFHGDAANDLAFVIVTGTATSGATLANLSGAAAVPNSHLLLANVLIPATATTITTANIDTTVRPRTLAVAPGQIAQGGATTGQYMQWNGTAWVPATLATTTELDYKEVTSSQASTTTSAATATAIITGNAVAYDGSTVVIAEFFAPSCSGSADPVTINWNLYDGSTDLGQIARAVMKLNKVPVSGKRRLTPSNATHTYSIRSWVSTGTGTTEAGAGGAGVDLPMFLRISRAA